MTKRNKALDSELMTEVDRLEYDCKARVGRVFMPAHCCVDMTGTIALFLRIDPEVQTIETFAGDQADTSYHRDVDPGAWSSLGHDGKWHGPINMFASQQTVARCSTPKGEAWAAAIAPEGGRRDA